MLADSDVVILSDYGKGGLTHIARMIELARAANKPVLVDPKGDDYARYRGATLLTPNRSEFREVAGSWKTEEELADKAQQLRRQLDFDALLVTRSEEGMTLVRCDRRALTSRPGRAKCSTCQRRGRHRDRHAVRRCWRAAPSGTRRCAWPTVPPASWSASSARRWCQCSDRSFWQRILCAGTGHESMYNVVTGAAGFIGANLVKALNERGETNIIAVDNLKKADKFKNLADCEIADYMDKEDFLDLVEQGVLDGSVAAIFHEGACSDTMETDGRYMMENNYRYSSALLDYCQDEEVPFLYASSASVYGGGRVFSEVARVRSRRSTSTATPNSCSTSIVRRMWAERTAQIVGFRYFNVYGPREQHKGRMASVAFHFFNQYRPRAR